MTEKNVCSTLIWVMAKDRMGKTPSFIVSGKGFITKPQEIDYFNNR